MTDRFQALDAYLQQEMAAPLSQQKRADLAPWLVGGGTAGALLAAIVSLLTRRNRPVAVVMEERDAPAITLPVVPNRAEVVHTLREEEERRREQEEREAARQEKDATTWTESLVGPAVATISGLSTFALVKALADRLRKKHDRRIVREEQEKLQDALNEKEILLAELRRRLKSEKLAMALVEQYLRFDDLKMEKRGGWWDQIKSTLSTSGKVIAGTSAAAFTLAFLIRAINAYREKQRRKLQQLRAFDRHPNVRLVTPEEQNFSDVIDEIELLTD